MFQAKIKSSWWVSVAGNAAKVSFIVFYFGIAVGVRGF